MYRHWFYSTQHNILGYLNTQTLHTRDEDIGVLHAPHRFMTQHIPRNKNEPAHEIMALFLHKLILQIRMRSHPVELDVWFLVGPFVYFHTSRVRTAKALAKLRECTGSPQPSLVDYLVSTIISWVGSMLFWFRKWIMYYLVHIILCLGVNMDLQWH